MDQAMLKSINVLLIEDNAGDARLIDTYLKNVPNRVFNLSHYARLSDVDFEAIAHIDVVLLDLSLPDSHGLESLYIVRDSLPDKPIIILTGISDEKFALEAIRDGAQDYLTKGGFSEATLPKVIQYAIQRKALEQRELELRVNDEHIRILEAFVANASHDLRTPLTSIITSAYLLRRNLEDVSLDEGVKRHLDVLEVQSLKMRQLLNDYLNMSMLDARDFHGEFAYADIVEVVKSAFDEVQAIAQKKQQRFYLENDKSIEIMADATQIHRALINVFTNAINYTSEQGEIIVNVFKTDHYAVVEIIDNGIGIKKSDLPHIFNRFYRADSARSSTTGGTGLGLAIVQRVMEIHNGIVEVDSKVDQGTTLRLIFPLPSDN